MRLPREKRKKLEESGGRLPPLPDGGAARARQDEFDEQRRAVQDEDDEVAAADEDQPGDTDGVNE